MAEVQTPNKAQDKNNKMCPLKHQIHDVYQE